MEQCLFCDNKKGKNKFPVLILSLFVNKEPTYNIGVAVCPKCIIRAKREFAILIDKLFNGGKTNGKK